MNPPKKLSGLIDSMGPARSVMSKIAGDTPEPAEPPDPPTAEAASAEADDDLVKAAKEALAEKVKTPRDFWLEEIKEADMTPAEAASIVDAMLTHGHYMATYRIGGKTVVKLRTRITTDTDRLVDIMQDMQPNTNAAMNHIISRVNLAASLISYGSSVFPHSAPTASNRETLDREWRDRYKFCESLPTPVYEVLTQLLSKFDRRVALATDVRGIENF